MGKLHDQMQEDLLLKAYSPNTQRNYLRCARHFCQALYEIPGGDGGAEVRDFLLYLGRLNKNLCPENRLRYKNT